jgi:hypothetical protein
MILFIIIPIRAYQHINTIRLLDRASLASLDGLTLTLLLV